MNFDCAGFFGDLDVDGDFSGEGAAANSCIKLDVVEAGHDGVWQAVSLGVFQGEHWSFGSFLRQEGASIFV